MPLQQPFGHEVESQTHCPLALHSCPAAQVPHVAPFVPHAPKACEPYPTHVPAEPPLQQPFEHVVASHEHVPLVLSQTPFEHELQEAPFVPHCVGDCEE